MFCKTSRGSYNFQVGTTKSKAVDHCVTSTPRRLLKFDFESSYYSSQKEGRTHNSVFLSCIVRSSHTARDTKAILSPAPIFSGTVISAWNKVQANRFSCPVKLADTQIFCSSAKSIISSLVGCVEFCARRASSTLLMGDLPSEIAYPLAPKVRLLSVVEEDGIAMTELIP